MKGSNPHFWQSCQDVLVSDMGASTSHIRLGSRACRKVAQEPHGINTDTNSK